jgi:hypothetical protein
MKKVMMPKRAGFLFFMMLALLGTGGLYAQQTFNTTIYFDYTSYLSSNGPVTSNPKDNFFAFRRAYFTYENRIGEKLRFRFRYDADNTANLTSVDIKSGSTKKDDKLRPFIKHLYLEWSDFLFRDARLRVGMSDTLTWKPAEDKWNYRSVAKTLLDGYKDITGEDIDTTSADLGVWYAGTMTKYMRWAVQVTNGSHYSHAETDKYKKFMGQLHLIPMAGLSVIGYYDYEKQNEDAAASTYKLDGYFEMVKNLTIGAEWFTYDNDTKLTADKVQYKVSGFSVFGNYIFKRDVFAVFGRYDSYEPNNKVDNNKVGLVIAGLDWAPMGPSIKLQPNVWFLDYQDSAKKNDVIFQFTFFLTF